MPVGGLAGEAAGAEAGGGAAVAGRGSGAGFVCGGGAIGPSAGDCVSGAGIDGAAEPFGAAGEASAGMLKPPEACIIAA